MNRETIKDREFITKVMCICLVILAGFSFWNNFIGLTIFSGALAVLFFIWWLRLRNKLKLINQDEKVDEEIIRNTNSNESLSEDDYIEKKEVE